MSNFIHHEVIEKKNKQKTNIQYTISVHYTNTTTYSLTLNLTLTLARACSKDFLIIHTPMVSAGARVYNRGLGAEPPAGV